MLESPPQIPEGTPPSEVAVRYERRDASVRALLWFGGGFLLVAVLLHLAAWWVYRSLTVEQQAHQPEVPPAAHGLPRFPQDLEQIPAPRIQVRDEEALRQLRREEDKYLHRPPSWVDRQRGIVRLPIDQALKRLAADPALAAAAGLRTLPPAKEQKHE
jgi:hypothetical protein